MNAIVRRFAVLICRCFVMVFLGSVLLLSRADAEVVGLDVTSREVVEPSPSSGSVGAYEVLKGTIHLEVDPQRPANHKVVDLEFAPRNERGMVEFSTEFELHKPVEPARGNRRLIYFVNNRGNKHGEGFFSNGLDVNWLYQTGWSYLWCGWNGDVWPSDRKLNIDLPIAILDGKPITGPVYSEIVSFANDPVPSMPLVWGGSMAYPPLDLEQPRARLTHRKYRTEPTIEVPRDQWSFARFEDGKLIPDPQSLAVEGGILPGELYELVYTGKDPRVTGLGMAAIRDVVSFFRYSTTGESKPVNSLAGVVDHAFAWGHSQSGRLLNHFVYQDFNSDEQGRQVFDGVIANCPGAGKGSFNSRFAQTTRHGSHLEDNLYAIDFFPLATVEQQDPETGETADAFAAARASGTMPKIMFLNSSTDYWTRAASLLHTDVEGTKDLAIDPSIRIYAVAGRAHTDGRLGTVCRALLVALDQWVSFGVEPPDSEVPRISDGTLVGLAEVRKEFPAIPDVVLPDSFYQPLRLDLGPRWREHGIADNAPPLAGKAFVALVPQVDADGNEIAGIRLPEIEVPIVTYTGWSLRSPSFSNSLRRNSGRVVPFAATAEERKTSGDPRVSILERYESRADYLRAVVGSLVELNKKRLLLDVDVVRLLKEAVDQAELLFGDLRSPADVAAQEGAEAARDHLMRFVAADMTSLLGVASAEQLLNDLNVCGYELMAAAELESACEVFRLNTLLFPESWVAWDSFGECVLATGDRQAAIACYEKSLELNPDNPNAETVLGRLAR